MTTCRILLRCSTGSVAKPAWYSHIPSPFNVLFRHLTSTVFSLWNYRYATDVGGHLEKLQVWILQRHSVWQFVCYVCRYILVRGTSGRVWPPAQLHQRLHEWRHRGVSTDVLHVRNARALAGARWDWPTCLSMSGARQLYFIVISVYILDLWDRLNYRAGEINVGYDLWCDCIHPFY